MGITGLVQGRPFTVPLFYKLVGNVPRAVATFQFLFSVACWGVLAVLVARAVQVSLLKPIAFLIVLLFSLSDQIIMWDSFLLSESIALSLMALLVASGVWLLEGWHWGKALFLVVVAFLWTFTRDTNPWVILMLAALLIVSQPRSLRCILMAAASLSRSSLQPKSRNTTPRTGYSLLSMYWGA